jgi:hypothetical protein
MFFSHLKIIIYILVILTILKEESYNTSRKNRFFKRRRPLKLIYYEAFLEKKDAQKKEKFYKSGRGHEVLYNNLLETFKNCY